MTEYIVLKEKAINHEPMTALACIKTNKQTCCLLDFEIVKTVARKLRDHAFRNKNQNEGE